MGPSFELTTAVHDIHVHITHTSQGLGTDTTESQRHKDHKKASSVMLYYLQALLLQIHFKYMYETCIGLHIAPPKHIVL